MEGGSAEDRRQRLVKDVAALREKAQSSSGRLEHQHWIKGLSSSVKRMEGSSVKSRHNTMIWYSVIGVVLSIAAYGFYTTMDPKCIVGNNLFLLEIARPAVGCDVCKSLEVVPTVDGDTFTQEKFINNFAYNGIPLLVKGGAKNWTALNTFTFKYLKDLFEQSEGALEAVENDCQFFPYKTDFLTLEEVFNMSEAMSQFAPGEKYWYVGWSNCNPEVAAKLRQHYQRPGFLPDDSESSNIDWLFMGGFGGGADVHIDYVQRPSWQAMIAGTKSWKIVPSPECESVCKTMNATMEKGDIILVDTNMWYHSTYIHPGEMSITIGSEYD